MRLVEEDVEEGVVGCWLLVVEVVGVIGVVVARAGESAKKAAVVAWCLRQ